jgi:hypothetical protein
MQNLPKESGHQKLTKGGCPNGKNQKLVITSNYLGLVIPAMYLK